MRAPILVLLALAAVAVALAMFVVVGGDPGPPAGGGESGHGGRARAVTAGAPEGVETEVAPRRQDVAGTPAPEPGAGETGAAPVRGFAVTVRVIDGATGAPVPFAEVAFMAKMFDWASMSDADKSLVWRFGQDRVAVFRHFGGTVRADAEGVVHLGLEERLLLACEHEGKYGQLDLLSNADPDRRDYELKLGPDATLRVRVVGPGGEPAPGMRLGVRPLYDDPVLVARQAAAPIGARTVTDDEGRANLAHLQEWGAIQRDGIPDRCGVRLLIPGVTEDAYVFDPKAPPAETVELSAPPTGEVRIRLLDGGGAPLGSYEDLSLREAPSPGDPAAALAGGARRQAFEGLPAGPGAARFPYVALGRRFEATATWEIVEKTFAGPAVAGQVVDVELHVDDEGRITFRSRLVDEAGQPLGRMHLDLHYETDRESGRWRVQAESDGHVRVSLDGDMAGQILERAVLQQVVRFEKSTLMGELPFRGPLRRGHHELGDTVMAPAPLIAAGVVTVDGEPPDLPVAVMVEFEDADGDWQDVPAAAVTWPETGVFEVRGSSSAARHRARPAAHSCLPADPVEFRPGQRDLRLELRRGGSLRVVPLLRDPARAGGLPFVLTADGPPTEGQRRDRRDRSPPDYFEPADGDDPPALGWRGLAAGTYRLRLTGLDPEPIVDLRGLVVPPGGPCTDGRLAPLDLREVLRYVKVTVIDGEGRPVGGSAIVWTAAGEQARGARVGSGRVVLPITRPVDLHVAARGHHVEELLGVDGDRVVRLRALPTVRIALPRVDVPAGAQLWFDAAPRGLPGDEREVLIGNRRHPLRRYLVPHGPRLPMGGARVVEVPARPGEELELRVWLDRNGESALVEGCAPATAGPGADRGAPVTLRVPASAVAATLEKLRR